MLSVVVATLDRPELLGRVLDRLQRQDAAPDDFEVVVAVDAAEPHPDRVERVAAGRARVVHGATPGVSATRNAGWRAAERPVILFLGDDMLPAHDLVRRHLEHHRARPDPRLGVLGHVRWARGLKRTTFMRWLDQGMQFDFRTIAGSDARWWHFYAANASLKRERLERAGGYDEDFRFGYEELDLARRLDDIGFELVYDRRAVAEHWHPPTIEAWQARMRTVGRAERQFVAKHPDLPPYFHDRFERALRWGPLRGRAIRVAPLVAPGVPVLGRWVWTRVDVHFAQQLAPAFMEGWDGGPRPTGPPRRAGG